MATPASYPYERGLGEFDRTVAAAQREIILQVRLALRDADALRGRQRLLQLARVTAILDQLGAYLDPAARQLVQDAYEQGAARAAQQIIGLQIAAPEIPGAFAGVSIEAVQVLRDSVTDSMQDARRRIGRQVDDIYRRAGLRAATRAVLGADGSPRTAARRMAQDLMRDRHIARMVANGGPGFQDAAGRKWTLDRYCRMVVRTTTREAAVQGAVDRMVSHGVTLARVSMHASACQVCKPYEGRLVDLAGTTRDYEGEAVMTGPLPPYHPNCRHSLAPVAVRIERIRREMQTTGLV